MCNINGLVIKMAFVHKPGEIWVDSIFYFVNNKAMEIPYEKQPDNAQMTCYCLFLGKYVHTYVITLETSECFILKSFR